MVFKRKHFSASPKDTRFGEEATLLQEDAGKGFTLSTKAHWHLYIQPGGIFALTEICEASELWLERDMVISQEHLVDSLGQQLACA